MKQREISIDALKFFAVLLITNSHMEPLYGEYSQLATGGAIGDVLFFFCSGFTLFLGQERRFDNYYKRRINRIYPTVLMWALMASVFFRQQYNMAYIVLYGGGWFVSCIMIYYVILHFIRKFAFNHLKDVFYFFALLTLVWYWLIDKPIGYNMYGATYFKWCHYFLFMLLGAILGSHPTQRKIDLKIDIFKLIGCIILFYCILIVGRKSEMLHNLQVVSLLPLLGTTYYFYKVCKSNALKSLYDSRIVGAIMKTISGLCFEVYLVQGVLFTDRFNRFFPLNIFIVFVIILIVAYLLRCMGRWFSQTFKDGDYEWKKVFMLY
ncbi:acyltransferase [Leyella stercorea DSM 18206]|jgi:hypothetical protein|uniref:Acyltransferase n=1 Tax=Leyella stercorea DSM 18206 TaxID=1002367 RepID=G6AX32_9BACT|nr:acyltransferase [Leyella stercorea]EHJ40808.1 acyltransferase [Leyella stercorea DSM 18206]